ncbi:uncharacterized protein PV07_00555 [Cladophialophora immunda]|uniref:Uncharacterized protein n=1 Tax=Cladophialophora immunda TaxID=569365 RepID=A0A0D2CR92_9EURO|nr:uncharacterized protein PV07_00555 [Cladophialophora immunda]KIW33728.1 hypothetical protein PV07_00555 [Cladophialophora immunda]
MAVDIVPAWKLRGIRPEGGLKNCGRSSSSSPDISPYGQTNGFEEAACARTTVLLYWILLREWRSQARLGTDGPFERRPAQLQQENVKSSIFHAIPDSFYEYV